MNRQEATPVHDPRIQYASWLETLTYLELDKVWRGLGESKRLVRADIMRRWCPNGAADLDQFHAVQDEIIRQLKIPMDRMEYVVSEIFTRQMRGFNNVHRRNQ